MHAYTHYRRMGSPSCRRHHPHYVDSAECLCMIRREDVSLKETFFEENVE